MDVVLELIRSVACDQLRTTLIQNPALANEPIPLPDNPAKAHPLHRICDGVFEGIYSDKKAAGMARIFLESGAHVDGNITATLKDTPLVAAASLHADEVALLYIEHGANILHAGCHGGTALHWAAWCGRDRLVKRLIEKNAPINIRCVDFKGTPLLWAVHGYKFGGKENRHNQLSCVRMLLQAGADKNIPNGEGTHAIEFLGEEDADMKQLLLTE